MKMTPKQAVPDRNSAWTLVRGALALCAGVMLAACEETPDGDADSSPTSLPTATPTLAALCEPDWDGDAYLANTTACVDAEGVTRPAAVPFVTLDCQIFDAIYHPGATELYDGKDNDCDGRIDEGTPYTDDDQDGFSEIMGDCDDTLGNINPASIEIPQDGVDSDCNGYDGRIPPSGDIADPSTYGTTSASKATAILVGPEGEANFMGWSSQVGDLDGDGIHDLAFAIGSADKESLESQGVVHVAYVPRGGYTGTLPYDAVTSWTVRGINTPNSLGVALKHGDLNGDGLQDLIVGDVVQRTIAVFFGGPRRAGTLTLNDADIRFLGAGDDSSAIGYAFDSPGDLDQDGFDELVIGQPEYNFSRGRALVYYGRSSWNKLVDLSEADATLTAQRELELGAMTVKGLGDLDGDGYPELALVSAYELQAEVDAWKDYIDFPAGAVYLYYGGPERLQDATFQASADAHLVADEHLYYLAGLQLEAADMDLDGHVDLAIGVTAQREAAVCYGTGERLSGDLALSSLVGTFFYAYPLGESVGDWLTVANLRGDALPELVMGKTIGFGRGTLVPGNVTLFWGSTERPDARSTNDSPSAVSIIPGAYGLMEIVTQVSAEGDLNGDSQLDLLVSTQIYPYRTARSAIYIFNGGSIP